MLVLMGQPVAVGIYCRISSDRAGGGLGVERQQQDCTELASRNGWSVVDVYVDNDMSAYSGKPRLEYRRLLADIEAGKITVVVTWHTDRLHRSPVELEHWIDVAGSRAVDVHTVKAGPIDLATPSGRMVARQLGAVARYESEHRSERVSAKFDQIARDGGFLGGHRPFGYTADGMSLEPVEADLIREGIRLILAGRSLRSVVAVFQQSGTVTSKFKKQWTATAVKEVLSRARNAGLLEHRGQVIGPAKWTPIVSEDEWRGVCTILNDPKRRTSPGNQPRWLGSLIYRCVCGDVLRVGGGRGAAQRPAVYRCRSAGDGELHVSRQAVVLDKFISDVIVGILSKPGTIELFKVKTPDVDTDDLRAQLRAIEVQREELGSRVGRGDITLSIFDAANSELKKRQAELESTLASTVQSSPLADVVGQKDVQAAWDQLPLDAKRSVLNELMTVTVMPAPRGRQRSGGYFDPESVKIESKTGPKEVVP